MRQTFIAPLPLPQAFPGLGGEQERARGARAGDKREREARENDMNECSECPRFRK